MTLVVVAIVLVLTLGPLGVIGAYQLGERRRSERSSVARTGRILFPFIGNALSQRTLDAALRLAVAEDATLVPVFLATVPLYLPLDTPLPRQCGLALPLQEAIDRRATKFGIPVDARIERGRNHRHAMRQMIEHETYDRIVIGAAAGGSPGFGPDDVAWILENAPGELVVLRPAYDEVLAVPTEQKRGTIRTGSAAKARTASRG